MRLGAPLYADCSDPERWIAALRDKGYTAAYCPLDNKASDADVQRYVEAARQADVIIGEVGAWSNPVSPDDAVRTKALEFCQAQLDQADRAGARCCVNIAGSRGEQWDGPHPDNLSERFFDRAVTILC